MDIKPGDWVIYKVPYGYIVYGEVTRVSDLGIKCLMGSPLYDYGYYPSNELEKLEPEELANAPKKEV